MADIDAFLQTAQPKTTSAKVCPRGDLLGLHEQLEEDLAFAVQQDQMENRHPQAPGLAKRIAEVEAEIAGSLVEFRFQSLGELAWSDLLGVEEHRPREEDRAQGLDYNPTTFPYAAVAACCVDPVMTAAQARTTASRINEAQWGLLWNACLRANVAGRDPFSLLASAVRAGTKPKRASRTTTGSPAASS